MENLKPITVWQVVSENEETGVKTFKHNHIEDGWHTGEYPEPIANEFSNQKAWKNMKWIGVQAYLTEENKVIKIH